MALRILSTVILACAATAWAAPIQRASDDAGTIYLGPIVDHDWGRPVAAGDLDGDGYDEVLVAASETFGGTLSYVYVMRGGPDGAARGAIDLTSNGIDLTIIGAQLDDNLGATIVSGDVNGDGYDDLLLCASLADYNGREENGAAYLLYGDSKFFAAPVRDLADPSTWDVRFIGPVTAGDMGSAGSFGGFDTHAADIGNLNGDAFADIAFGVHLDENGSLGNAGSVYLVAGQNFASGTTIDLANTANVLSRIYGRHEYDEFGDRVFLADVTGDGLDDLVVGNHYYSQVTFGTEGAVIVFRGRTTWASVYNLVSVNADITILGDYSYDDLGEAVAVGDFNGDGIMDIAASAPGAEDTGNNTNYGDGYVYGFYGRTAWQTGTQFIDVAVATPSFLIKGEFHQNLGAEISAGDFNGDGIDDVAAVQRFAGGATNGTIDIVFGRAFTAGQTFIAGSTTDVRILGNPNDRIGFSVGAGNVNGDGADEVLFGTPFNNGPTFSTQKGTVYVFSLLDGDHDGDGALDLADFAALQACYALGGAPTDHDACYVFDMAANGALDASDVELFVERLTGPQ